MHFENDINSKEIELDLTAINESLLESNNLKDKTILIDPGHGGYEIGGSGNGYKEKDLNLETSLLLEEELKKSGVKVLMTRRTDVFMSVERRGEMAKKTNSVLFSVHFNGFNGTARGTEMIYSFASSASKISSILAQNSFNEVLKLGVPGRRVFTKESSRAPGRNWYGVLRSSEPMFGIIAEGLFLDNKEDAKFLKDKNFIPSLAKAYARAICKTIGAIFHEDLLKAPHKAIETISFRDIDNVSPWALKQVLKLKEEGIFQGDRENNFHPKKNITREEMAVVIFNLLKKYNLIKAVNNDTGEKS